MRLAALVIYSIAIFIISIPKMLFLQIRNDKHHKKVRTVAYAFQRQRGIHFLKFTGASYIASGLENIRQDRAVLFVSNHLSQFDIPLLVKYIDEPVGFIAKKELAKIPLLKQWMSLQGCLFLDRKHARKALQTILEGINLMKNGESMVIFPQGTRSEDGEFLDFKQGSLKLAEKSGALIVPVAICGTDKLFEANKAWKLTPATVHISFLPPVDLTEWSDEDRRHSARIIQTMIEDEYNRLSNL